MRPTLVLLLLAAAVLADDQDDLARDVEGYLAEGETSFWTRSKLTGDWGGRRTRLAEKGIALDVALVGVVQGVADGGRDNAILPANQRDDVEVLGFLDVLLRVDTQKAGLWEGGFLTVRIEGRVGDSVVRRAGTILPVNTLAILPATGLDDDVLEVSDLSFVQFLSERFGVFLGLLNGYEFDYLPFAGVTRGKSQFLNLAFQGAPIFTGAPVRSLGGGAIFIPNERVASYLIVQSTKETSGRNPFENLDGITVSNENYVQFELAGRPAGAMVGLVLAWDEFTALGQDLRVLLPGGGTPTTEDFTWAAYFNFFWYVKSDEDRRWTPLAPADTPRGWGVFFRLSVTDGDPDPVQWAASAGIGGNVPFRPDDTFGVGFFFLGMSDENIVTSLNVDDEFGFEAWYRIAVSGFAYLTLDFQIVEPGLPGSDTAVVLGLRLHADF